MFEEYKFPRIYQSANLADVHQNQETIDMLNAWLKKPVGLLYLTGNVGTGKTYCAAAIYNFLKEQEQVRAYSERFLMNELKECMNRTDWSVNGRIRTICESKYLVIDDLGSGMITDWQKECWMDIIDNRVGDGFPTIITSNLTQNDLLKNFHPRFESRVYSKKNVIIELHQADRRKM